MPSANVLESKKQTVVNLTEKLKNAAAGVIVDYQGINVENDTKMRKEFREAGVEYAVVKNSMLRFACKNAGLDDMTSVLEGCTAIAISNDDVITPAKIAAKYADTMKDCFTIKIGFMEGKVMDANEVTALGKLPSKEQLLGQLLSVLTGNLRGLAVALNAIAEQKESA